MQIIAPRYYDTFHCLADTCPDSCCKEWAVQVDEASVQRYRALPGDLGDVLRRAMVQEDGDTVLALTEDRRCPMWRADGLCRIQAQLGEDGLCHTCREFPRLRHDYGDFVELGLELSCPEAARLILSDRACETVVTCTDSSETPLYDAEDMALLRRSRDQVLSYLCRTDCSVGRSLTVVLLYAYSVQTELDGGDPAVFDADVQLTLPEAPDAATCAADIFQLYRTLNILTPRWEARLMQPSGGIWREEHRAMARYLVSRYWLQAVSDHDLAGRVKFIVTSCLVVKLLGGDVYGTAQLYSKEIENDAENVDVLLDCAYEDPALTDVRLLHLLAQES